MVKLVYDAIFGVIVLFLELQYEQDWGITPRPNENWQFSNRSVDLNRLSQPHSIGLCMGSPKRL